VLRKPNSAVGWVGYGGSRPLPRPSLGAGVLGLSPVPCYSFCLGCARPAPSLFPVSHGHTTHPWAGESAATEGDWGCPVNRDFPKCFTHLKRLEYRPVSLLVTGDPVNRSAPRRRRGFNVSSALPVASATAAGEHPEGIQP
jgi:hypothetical protein